MRALPGCSYILTLLLWLALPRAAAACASCGCGDPTLTAMGQEKPFKNRVRLALEQRLGAHFTGAPAEQSLVSRTAVSASWSPLPWLTLGTLAPLVVVRSEAAKRAARETVGFGDAELLVRDGDELEVLRQMVRERGIPTTPPPTWQPSAREHVEIDDGEDEAAAAASED